MNALREIVEVKNNQIVVNLPSNFRRQKVEVIVLLETAEEVFTQETAPRRKQVDYDQYFGVTNIGQDMIDRQLKHKGTGHEERTTVAPSN